MGGRSTCGSRSWYPGPFVDIAASGGRAAEITLLEGDGAGAKLVVAEGDGVVAGALGSPERDAEAQRDAEDLIWAETSELRGPTFVDVVGPPPRLIVFGAVPVAAALCTLARAAGWRPFVVDPRTRFATQDRFPDAEAVIAAWPDEAFAQLGGIDPATSIAVLTHDPKLDDAALGIALRSPARFVGAMGSRRAQDARRERLLAAGFESEDLERLAGAGGARSRGAQRRGDRPVDPGRDGGARHGRDGGRLRSAGGPDPRSGRVTLAVP